MILSRMIQRIVDGGLLKVIKTGLASREVLNFSGLFADDTIVFYEASAEQFSNYFAIVSGLKVKLSKNELDPQWVMFPLFWTLLIS